MIRIHLDDATRDEHRALRHEPLPPKGRDRIEMLTLADAGWSPRIAGHCSQTARDLFAGGIVALHPRRTVPPPDSTRRDRVAEEQRRSLAEGRTLSRRQLSQALAEEQRRSLAEGRTLSRRQLSQALAERSIALGPRLVIAK
ncbi:MAG: helix-turn-helix domain-containing protein [Paludisphaera borealis]|uniref:helix-turn-helix domain-containing protein n=1 Tax=Paludisphaera borealis TaxID=1387353 RepID=UPI00284B8CE5|nr:helix-turn-helix domain-containing protein [Paludisphaera borealis]MDR3618768.1 helix-turn-helix domain-containing protein [Paludisphaera borealis]